jgi:hypothetical protein
LLWLFLEIGAHEIFALHQKYGNMKITEYLRKEMNSLVCRSIADHEQGHRSHPQHWKILN